MFKKYLERFGKYFPTEEYASQDPRELIKECLKEDKPIEELYPHNYEDIEY